LPRTARLPNRPGDQRPELPATEFAPLGESRDASAELKRAIEIRSREASSRIRLTARQPNAEISSISRPRPRPRRSASRFHS